MSNFDVTDLVIQQEAARQATQDLSKALSISTRAADSLKISVVSLQASLVQNVDFVHKLTQAVQMQEKLQLKSNAIGLNFNKFMSKNSEKLEKFAMLLEGRQFMLDAFDAGLRRVSDGVVDLADNMTRSGQDTNALIRSMVGFGLVTDQNTEVQDNLARITEQTTKKYLVSNERLLEGLSNFQGQLEDFRIYGPETVGKFAELSTVLMGVAGGSEPAKKQIGIFLQMLDGMNLQQQHLLGLTGVVEDIYSGGVTQKTLDDIVKASDMITQQLGSNRIAAAHIAEVYGRPQIGAIQMLGGLIKTNNKDIKGLKEISDKESETLRSRQAQIDNFYNQYAPEIHRAVTYWLPLINTALVAVVGVMALKGAGRALKELAAAGSARASGLLSGGAVRAAGAIGAIAARGAAFIGGPISIAAMVGYGIWQLVDLMGSSNDKDDASLKEQKKQTELLKEQNDPSNMDNRLSAAARVASAMVGMPQGATLQDLKTVLEKIEGKMQMRRGGISPLDGSK